jgi:ribosome assembly protein YihI (activator of Der GTPase)
MSQAIHLDLELPGDLARFKLPAGVNERLSALLDKQDAGEELTVQERREAASLVDLADTLTYLGLKAKAQTS